MDHYELFPRSGNLKPFLLLDGHGSRFEIPFLRYVTDREHPWMVCQGVPYGTSLWQVADSSEQNGSFKAASSHIKMEILKKRLDMMMDNPSILATDIIPIVNYAWKESFARVETNRKAIADRGWNPLNYNLLTNKQITPTMTNSEIMELRSMLEVKSTSSTATTNSTQQSTESTMMIRTNNTSLSSLTDDGLDMNYDPKFIARIPQTVVTLKDKLNFKTGRSAHVARALIHESDILEARERNQMSANKGKEAKAKIEKAKKLSAMLNFKAFGCKIGEDSLKARLKMAEKKNLEVSKIMQKKNERLIKRKMQFDEVVSKMNTENLPLDKLSLAQFKILCAHKKRDSDKVSVSKLNRQELLALWLEWQHRPEVAVVDTTITTIPEGHSDDIIDDVHHDPLEDDHGNSTVIVNNNDVRDESDMNVTMI